MDSRTGDVADSTERVVEPGVDSPQPMALNRKLRRTLKAMERRANRRLLRAAYRELRMLRREEGQLPFKTNAIEQAELEGLE